MMRIKISAILILISLLSVSCSNNDNDKKADYKNLNLTILLDLSDRISSVKNPEQKEKDIKIVSFIIDSYKNFLAQKGVVNSEDKIKVIFYPAINNEVYQSVADSLNIDFAQLDFPHRKKLFGKISDLFTARLTQLYSIASKAKVYEGSDLFNYFKHRVVDDCIINDSNYINILAILTDGYIYDKNNQFNSGNRFSYIAPEAEHVKYFRKLNNWENVFNSEDYGLITIDNDLSKLNIIVAELNPVSNSPKDFDIMKLYWSKWFEEQKVKKNNYKILKTDLTSINKNLIRNYFEKILSR